MSEPVPTDYQVDAPAEVAVAMTDSEMQKIRRRERFRQQADEARQFARYGSKVLKVKLKVLKDIGADLESHGIKYIGHGKIALAGETAHESVNYLVDLVQQLQTRNPPAEPELIIAAMKEMRAWNKQVMECGKEHIDATKQAENSKGGNSISIPFPAGTPIGVMVGGNAPVPIEAGK